MTKLLVGVAGFITFLMGLVMMMSVGIIGGSAASPTAQQEIPPELPGPLSIGGRHLPRAALVGAGGDRQGRDQPRPTPGTGGHLGSQLRRRGRTMQIGIGGKAGNTFGAYAVDGDGDGDGISNVYNPADAIFTAANYLCQNGANRGADVAGAVFAYNHADWYVTKVLAIASSYEAARPAPWGGGPAPPPNHDVAAIAIQFAYNQLGKPYV